MIARMLDQLHRLFAPREDNNFRARALHHDALTFYLFLAIAFVVLSKSNLGIQNVLGFATDISAKKLYELTNRERVSHNLRPLKYNERLSQAANKKARDMLKRNYWAHYGPDGTAPWKFIYDAGYNYEYAGENLAKNFLYSTNVVSAWMASPSHRENLLRREYSDIGFAIVNGVLNGEETTLVVQLFGTPTSDNFALQETDIQKIKIDKDLAGVQATAPATRGRVNIFWIFISFLTLGFAADLYFASRLGIVRFHGKNLPHLIFFGFISLGVILFITKGAIL